MSNPASEYSQRKMGLLVDGDICPTCKGDGYIEMGDRQTDTGLEAWVIACICQGGDIDDLPDWVAIRLETVEDAK